MSGRNHRLALGTQARLLGLARSTVYSEPRPVSAADRAVMRRLGTLHLDYPFAGSRMMWSMLVNEGIAIGPVHVRTLMCRMRTFLDGGEHRGRHPFLCTTDATKWGPINRHFWGFLHRH